MMNTIAAKISKIRLFSYVIGIYLLILALALILWGYEQSFVIFNSNNISWLDRPMFLITHFGDSLILASIMSLCLIRKRPDTVLTIILIVIITGLISQLLKVTLFEGWDRPLRIFNESKLVHTLPNYRLFHNSFPSGHSVTAMSAFTAMMWSLKPRKLYQLLAAVAAIIITYSRIYLGVHFPGDVLAGSLIGIVCSFCLLPLTDKLISKIRFNSTFKIVIIALSIIFLVVGTYYLRVYFQ